MNDIFIDNDFIVLNFHSPDEDVLKFIQWLYDEEGLENKAHLILSQKLYNEYVSSSSPKPAYTNILTICSVMLSQGRLLKVSNEEIRKFKDTHMPNKIHKKLTCNKKDREHIPIILLSNRKMGITNDKALKADLQNFKGFNTFIEDHPKKLNYK